MKKTDFKKELEEYKKWFEEFYTSKDESENEGPPQWLYDALKRSKNEKE